MRVYGRHIRWTLCLTAVLLAAASPAASALVVHNHRGHFFGVTPHRNVSRAALLKAIQGTSPSTASSTAGKGPLSYHSGPVLHTSAPYLIFWAPNGEVLPSSWKALTERFFADVAADSGQATNEYAVNRQYSDYSGAAGTGEKFSPSQVIVDTQAYPAPDSANCPNVSSGYPTCLTDTQVQQEVERLIGADGLPNDGSATASTLPANAPVYFVVLPSDVNECLDSADCADNSFCAYHSSLVDGANNILYAAIPTLPVAAAGQDPKACQVDGTSAVQEPNGSPADVVLKYLSHEDSESITDPLGTGWYSSYSGNENGDNCNAYGSNSPVNGTSQNAFLPTLGGDASAGTLYDQTIDGDHYYLQSLWSNGDSNCEMVPTTGSTTAEITSPSGTYLAGSALSFSDSASTGSVTSATWDWGDGSTTSTGGTSPLATESHTYATGGTYTVTLTLFDNRGNAATATQPITVYPTAAFTSAPSQPVPGSAVSFDASSSSEPGGTIANYTWSFGDGTSSSSTSSPQTTHTYSAAGTYTVKLTVTDSAGRVSNTTSEQLTVAPPPPVVSFTINPTAASVAQPVSFDASATQSGGSITNYSWSFGDGQTSSGSTDTSPTNTYAGSGTYTVTLTVTAGNSSTTVTKQLTVGPIASFMSAPTQPADGQPVSFDGSGSSDPEAGARITAYTWHFGDETADATGPSAQTTHAYRDPGTYTATLTVTNGSGETNTTSRVVTVTDTPPTAAFSESTASSTPGQSVQFDGSASAPSDPSASITSYSWSFGDNSTATGRTVAHAFASSGTYTVRLTVTDSYGASSTVTETVTVQAPPSTQVSPPPPVSTPSTSTPPSDEPPTAVIAVGTAEPVSGLPVVFSGAGSSDADGAVVSYRWSFGDGATATTSAPSHTYAKAGTYGVSLTVVDNAGQSTTAMRYVTVAAAGRITKVAVRPSRGGATLTISLSSGGTLTAGKRVFHLKRAATVKVVITLTRSQLRTVQIRHQLKVRLPLRFVPLEGRLATASAVIAFRPARTSGRIAPALVR